MLLDVVEQVKMVGIVEKHATHNFCKNVFGCTCDTCVVEQVTGTCFGSCKEGIGQPACNGILVKASSCLKEFNARQYTAVLVLPTATCRKQLLKYERAVTDFVFVPT